MVDNHDIIALIFKLERDQIHKLIEKISSDEDFKHFKDVLIEYEKLFI